jgi:outer membrane protein insertion porin family
MKWARAKPAWAIAALMLLNAASSRPQQANQLETPQQTAEAPTPMVVAVRILTQDGKIIEGAPSGLPLTPGKPLDPEDVAESLRILYRSGNYADLRAERFDEPGGVRVDIIVRRNFYFNAVRIEGLVAPPTDASAAAAMEVSLGAPYRRDLLDEALSRLKTALQEEGLYQAEVTAETVPHEDTRQMDVVVHVKPGPRAGVASVHITNNTEFPDRDFLDRLKMNPGKSLTTAHIQSGTNRIRKFLVKRGHLGARAQVQRGKYDRANHTVPIELEVDEGPRVRVVVVGAKFSNSDIKRLVPIYQEGAVDADLLEEGKRNLQERLESRSYFDAEVNYSTQIQEAAEKGATRPGKEQVITYRVERGVPHKLMGIAIEGNHYFGDELLKSRLQIYRGAFGSRGRFSQRLIDADVASMANLYHANGFLSARVTKRVQDNYQGKEGRLFVTFLVDEGPQTRVASLSVEGNHAFSKDQLMGVVGSTPGQPYSDINVATDRDNILALYFNEGFPNATFTATAEAAKPEEGQNDTNAGSVNGDGSKKGKDQLKGNAQLAPNPEIDGTKGGAIVPEAPPINLVYHIDEGSQLRVRNLYISGYENTRPGIIRRQVQIKTKAPLREGDVVESQRRLYNLGVFNRVSIEPQNPNGTDNDKNVVVLVEEAKRYTIAYGGGFEVQRLASTTNPTGGEVQAAPRGILELTKNNLTGRADSLSFKVRGSTIEDRALLAYTVPNPFTNEHLSFQTNVYTEKTQDINTFTENRYEGNVQLTDHRTRLTSLVYHYAFRRVVVSNLNTHVAPEEIPLFEQPTLVSQFGVTWARDARDNPADATKGNFNSADISDADTNIGSSASFFRMEFQNSTYHPIKRRFSFARSTRFGVLIPYRDTASLNFQNPAPGQCSAPAPNGTGTTTENIIPLPERFFAGGGTSLRGFALNQAGPRDPCTGFPVGGQALLIFNQEFRFPMRLPFVPLNLGGAIFYDGGNVYSRLSRISFAATLPKPTFTTAPNPSNPTGPPITVCVTNCSNELNYFSHTIGFGIRYATPVGPIRVDLGYQLNRPFFVIPCTNNVPGCQQAVQLPRFQIFFNLGSSF